MKRNAFSRRFLTRGSTRWGRAECISKADNGMLVLAVLSYRSASRKLMPAASNCWSEADGKMTGRPKL